MSGQDPAPFTTYAEAFGLAFQITDDILDETGDEAKLGKRVQKDAAAGKATFVSLLGMGAAQQLATDLIDQAKTALAPFGASADLLNQAADFVLTRDR